MSAVPVLRDELNRKSLEAITDLIRGVHLGRITPHQFSTGIDALWTAVAGLIDEKIIDLITAGGDEAPVGPAVDKRVFIHGEKTASVTRLVGSESFEVKFYVKGVVRTSNVARYDDSEKARDGMKEFVAKLLAGSYIEI